MAAGPSSQAGRTRPVTWRGVAGTQGSARLTGVARSRQDQSGGGRRSSGNDRYGRLCRGPVAHVVWHDDAFRTGAASNVGAMASARTGRRHYGLQFSSGSLGLECLPGCDCRRYGCVEAFTESAALRDRGAASLQPSDGATGLPRDLFTDRDGREDHRGDVGPGSSIPIDFVHRVRPGRSSCGLDRRATAGADAFGTEREQRDHRGSDGGPLLGDSRHRVRGGRHRRPTLHDDQTAVRPRVSLR